MCFSKTLLCCAEHLAATVVPQRASQWKAVGRPTDFLTKFTDKPDFFDKTSIETIVVVPEEAWTYCLDDEEDICIITEEFPTPTSLAGGDLNPLAEVGPTGDVLKKTARRRVRVARQVSPPGQMGTGIAMSEINK